MKTCMLCGASAPAAQPTCLACGEATWKSAIEKVEIKLVNTGNPNKVADAVREHLEGVAADADGPMVGKKRGRR